MARSSCLFTLVVQEFERRYLLKELIAHGWNRKRTALDLGLSYGGLRIKIRRLDLRPDGMEILEDEKVPADEASC